ncbi:MAG: DUF2029 domain-containing protein [Ardenticatenaceae bacterium]|nr:DUF2029 domain-containing protein [Ardenticatenaceae bacterium]MCB9443057.1 DUF2029 domain-containing protein [Ardenticatenaceae bacterium]
MSGHMWFNPVSNALIVVGLAVYIGLDFIPFSWGEETAANSRTARMVFVARLFVIFYIIMAAVLLFAGFNILQRRAEGVATNAHDGLIQTEIAVQYLLEGKNPYTEDYINTPMADFAGQEPPLTDAPLYHNAYLPFLFIGSIPFYLLSQATLGWYDQRFVYLLAYGIILLVLPLLVEKPHQKLAMLIAFGLNFLFVYYMADGRNDIMIMLWLVLALVLLKQGHVGASALVIGLAMVTKHQAWFFLPFYFLYLLPKRPNFSDLRTLVVRTWPLFVVTAVILVPFLVWDGTAFVDDTVFYLIGTGESSFPMKGWGFSTLLLAFKLVPSPEAAFPFWIVELVFGLPVLLWLLRRQWLDNNLQNLITGFALFSFVFQFFSRFFSDNYFVFILQLLVIAYFAQPVRFYQTDSPLLEPVGLKNE